MVLNASSVPSVIFTSLPSDFASKLLKSNNIELPTKIQLREFPACSSSSGVTSYPITQIYEDLKISSSEQSKSLCIGHATVHLSSAASVGMYLLPVGTTVVFEHSKTIRYNNNLTQALQFLVQCLKRD